MRHQLSILLLVVTLSLTLSACTDGSETEDFDGSAHFGLDESISCPEGEVGWRFPKTPLNPDTEEFVQQSGGSAVVEITDRFAIEIQTATCGGAETAELALIRNQCAGSLNCRYTPTCGQSFDITYTCGVRDTDSNGVQRTYTATTTGGVVEPGCTQPAREVIEVETRVECVPRECHGRARRDLNMRCVENPSATEVAMRGGFGSDVFDDSYWIFPRLSPQTPRNEQLLAQQEGEVRGEHLYPGLPYSFALWLEFWYGLVPEESSVVVWMSDNYQHQSTGQLVEGFRCVAFKRDLRPEVADRIGDDQKFTIIFTGAISEDCASGGRVSEDNAAKRLGISLGEFRQNYAYYNSKMRASYDMEGNTVWHKPTWFRYARDLEYLAYNEPECTPNPQDFFYDANTGTYDLIAYYGQREFVEPDLVEFVEPSMGRRAYILPGPIRARSALTIRTTSNLNASLPINLNWDTANLNQENPFNPWAEGVEIGAAWEAGKSLPGANFAPTNLRASVFIYPWGAQPREGELYSYKIGEIPLQSLGREGSVETVNLPISENVKRYFTRQSSAAYIEDDTRLFRLFYCIESDDHPQRPGYAFKTRQGLEYYDCPNRDFCAHELDQNYVIRENITDPNSTVLEYTLELDTVRNANQASQPFGMPMRGCRVSDVPLRVNIDRFTTPLEPIASAGATGSTSNRASGDEKMSGSNDNDKEVNCTGVAQDNCVEAVSGGNRTEGENGQSTYNLDSRLARRPGEQVSSSMTAEMLGFQLIDPMDPASSSVSYPADTETVASTPVAFSLAPDWDGIKASLQRASAGRAEEWDTGRYGGQMGLGVGWGYKWRWQIGPVPVLVSFTFTVGASVALEAEVQFRPSPDQAYPCIGTEPCYVKFSQPASFRDAARTCNLKGGRLAELSSQVEANALDQVRGQDEIWLGAQLAYRHPKPACATNYNSSECLPQSRTEYRWMSNSQAFATNQASGAPTFFSANIFNALQSGLGTRYPNDSAVVYRPTGNLGSLGVDNQRPFVCSFDPAASQRFLRWQLALNMGAAAGFNLTGCVPNDNPGFCLGAGFNIVALSIGPKYESIFHWLYRPGESEPFSRRGNTNVSVPWSLKLFEGQVVASVNFLWFSISWNLVSYDGITAAEGKLYDADTPVIESLQ